MMEVMLKVELGESLNRIWIVFRKEFFDKLCKGDYTWDKTIHGKDVKL
jgi:hypothetical protein